MFCPAFFLNMIQRILLMLCKTHIYVGQKMSWIFMGRKVELEGRRTVVKVVVHQNKILCHEDPVKSIKIFIGCHPRFFRVASAQIFVRVAAWGGPFKSLLRVQIKQTTIYKWVNHNPGHSRLFMAQGIKLLKAKVISRFKTLDILIQQCWLVSEIFLHIQVYTSSSVCISDVLKVFNRREKFCVFNLSMLTFFIAMGV